MMYGMSKEGLAPKCFQRIASNGVPRMTVVVMGVALLVAVVLNYLMPEQGLCPDCLAGGVRHRLGVADDPALSFLDAPRFVGRRAQ